MSFLTHHYAAFANKYDLGPDVAYVLPAVFESAAKKVGRPTSELLSLAIYYNRPLGEYLADCARKVAKEDREKSI